MKKKVQRVVVFFLRVLSYFIPGFLAFLLLKYSRGLFSLRVNELLETHFFTRTLKECPRTIPIFNLTITFPIIRNMTIRVGDESQRCYYLSHQDEVAVFLHRILRKQDTFFDVGANCGFMSLLASSIIPSKRIYCFEPNPVTFSYLKQNIDGNFLSAQLFNIALSDKKERCRLFVPEGACGGSSIEAKNYRRRDLLPNERPPTFFHEVSAERFDDIWTLIGENDIMNEGNLVFKLDAEGHELPIILGMKNFLSKYLIRIFLIIECYDSEYDDLIKETKGLGFDGFLINCDGTLSSIERPGKNCFRNYYFKAHGDYQN